MAVELNRKNSGIVRQGYPCSHSMRRSVIQFPSRHNLKLESKISWFVSSSLLVLHVTVIIIHHTFWNNIAESGALIFTRCIDCKLSKMLTLWHTCVILTLKEAIKFYTEKYGVRIYVRNDLKNSSLLVTYLNPSCSVIVIVSAL